MGKTYIVKDVLEAFVKSENGKTYFYGLTTETSVVRNMTQELIRAGIGSKVVGTINDSEGYDINITTGLHYEDTLEIQIGEEYKAVTDLSVQKITEDEDGTVTATSETVAGNAIELEALATPKNCELQLHGIGYDPDDNSIACDIYWIFPKASPSGDFTQSYGMGTNNVQELSFKALVPKGSTSYGKYVIVPRETPVEP